MKIFKYYKDLIHFKVMGDPVELLRTVIPSETNLFDRAAGVHVRFRLGGSTFPPLLLFKVYTHRPCCDVNSFAPRDYTVDRGLIRKDDSSRFSAAQSGTIRVGTKYFETLTSTNCTDISRWYQREERNSWRPIVHQTVVNAVDAALLAQENRKAYHYSNVRRRSDLQKKRRHRRTEWFVKLYMQQKQTTTSNLDLDAPPQHHTQLEQQYGDVVADEDKDPELALLRELRSHMLRIECREPSIEEAQELLEWSCNLDYNDYTDDWFKLATSAPSDRERLTIKGMPSVVSLGSEWP